MPTASAAPIFTATLTPHRSLTGRGFLLLMAAIGLLWFLTGYYFYRLGAWPVLGFFGLDFLLLWLAFKLNYRAARAYEEVRLGADLLVIRKIAPNGRVQEFSFNPAWVRLQIHKAEEEGVTRILVHSRGQSVPVGAFLNPEDRTSFAGAFSAALSTAKRG